MKGVILAGGTGTRLKPMTLVTNKHLLPVYDRPMIEYPLKTLIDVGCTDVLIVSGGNHIGAFAEYLGDGSRYGVSLTYRVQKDANGIAGALNCAKGYVNGLFPVILGDNYFEVPVTLNEPGIVVSYVEHPERFGVYDVESNTIIEKPEHPISNYAVTGLYWYDESILDEIPNLVESKRGELEVTDLNNTILKQNCVIYKYEHMWSDMGTINSLNEVSNYVKQLQD